MQDIRKKFWLEKFDCFSITGKDARKFLNGITTGNILDSENKVIKTCWLTPNGVLRSLIEIIFFERNLEVIILAGNINEIINYFNQIIFPVDDVFLSEPFIINRIQEIDESSSWRTYQPIFFKKEDKEFEIYKNNLNLLNSDDLKIWKVNQAIPSLDMELNGKNNPLELGLKDLIDFNKGDMWMLVCVITWSLYSTLLKKNNFKLSQFTLIQLMVSVGILFLIPQFFYEKSIGLELNLDKNFFLILIYVAIFPAIAAYYFWQKGIEIIGPNRASMFIQLMPLFSAVMAIIIFKEKFELYHFVGAIFILSGIYLSNRKVYA